MNKKGAEMSMNVVIIAVIALLILVVLVYFVANTSQNVNNGTECVKAGGVCREDSLCSVARAPDDTVPSCSSPRETCCKIIG